MKGRVQHFRSSIDATEQPCVVCATDGSSTSKPLIVEVSPNGTDLPGGMRIAEDIASTAAEHGRQCIVLRPTGRGPGTVYQNYGEVDLLEALEHVCARYPVDRRRISITGVSMGGAAVWYLISHYPDLFAAAAPVCGYCDYRLWEEPSWRSRSAVFLAENLLHTPVWIVHGEWDRAVGGGQAAFSNRWAAENASQFFKARNGGVHRGGIMGETSVELQVADDAELSRETRLGRNLILYGNRGTNAILAEYGERIPVRFAEGCLELLDRRYEADGVAAFALFPHPENPDRCVAVHGGACPDAVCWGSHLDMMLLPDYLVYARGEVLDWGFWNGEWRFAERGHRP